MTLYNPRCRIKYYRSGALREYKPRSNGRGRIGIMRVYIIPPLRRTRKNDSNDSKPTVQRQQIAYGERACWCGNPENHWRAMNELVNELMKELDGIDPPVQSLYSSLRKNLDFDWWPTVYATINPFGEDLKTGPHSTLPQHSSVFTFDLTRNEVTYKNAECTRKVSLDVLRDREMKLRDVELVGPALPPPISPSMSPELPYWKPQFQLDERVRVFGHRLLRDFDHQWRCLLRDEYNPIMRRTFAQAIIYLATFNFSVKPGHFVQSRDRGHWESNLPECPEWDPVKQDVFMVGRTWFVLAESMESGLAIAREHLRSRGPVNPENTRYGAAHVDYIVLSIKYIMLCHVTETGDLEQTAPEPLLNGHYHVGPPSDLALDYLLWGTASARMTRTHLSRLPVEIQDMILNQIPNGPVSVARVSCCLRIGTIPRFRWAESSEDVILLETSPEEERVHTGPPDILIGFGKQHHRSELAYGVFGTRRPVR